MPAKLAGALALLLAALAGWTDWRSRRIPNWLTMSGLAAGIATNTIARGWPGLRFSLSGAGLGLLLLLPFVLLRSLGAGDWKLAGAVGALLGPSGLIDVLMVTILLAGVMALIVVIRKGRLRQTLGNIAGMLAAIFQLRLPGPEVSIDNPESSKIPFGVAMAGAVLLVVARNLGVRG
jgi:prepilin peptidase CpaA